MDTTYTYQDAVDNVIAAFKPAYDSSDNPICVICGREYGSGGAGFEPDNINFLSQLPGPIRRRYIEDTVEAIQTPCNHTFCLQCISFWCQDKAICTCPMCRHPIILKRNPADLERPDQDLFWDENDVLCLPPRCMTVLGWENRNIFKLQTRDLVTTMKPMPFRWIKETMLHDLPVIMVSVARRFYYHDLRPKETVPCDLLSLARHDPSIKRFPVIRTLEALARDDAPIAYHEDAFRLHEGLCDIINDPQGITFDNDGTCQSWGKAVLAVMTTLIEEKTLVGTDGGVSQRKWWMYVWCVIKALMVWQAYAARLRVVWRLRHEQGEYDWHD
ncbi:hypothetical protein COCMIDRAFT_93277 [Bipolaris oryzae ATCC 44560]|uniref:RING-type domain-containing protein n=1 Tax=Bipolaris oryzae ATCC 44560 TaxID=930090 RepID=W6ZRG2_COCMI|nr:uncharacterized protein COCMIDRAFT_93277 [Bipolaris oryzae ATCC 44560]EUC46286.1 hypothetical protein COCMIDRAFT_93277 [Bipolaris oryzae ATCC 44560]